MSSVRIGLHLNSAPRSAASWFATTLTLGLSLATACSDDAPSTNDIMMPDADTDSRNEESSSVDSGGQVGSEAGEGMVVAGEDDHQDTTTHTACTLTYTKDPRDDTMTGELVHVVTNDNETPDDLSDDPYDLLLPQEMMDWLQEQNWIQTHGDWHSVRRWDQGCMRIMGGGVCQSAQAMMDRGLSRAPIQEGEPGDGLAFLAMHRHMLRGFREAFPKHADTVLRSFTYIPKAKDDPENPIPWVNVGWSDSQLEAIAMMENIGQHLDLFTSEDDYAKWVQFGDGFGAGGPPGGFPGGGLPPGFDFDGGSPGSGAFDPGSVMDAGVMGMLTDGGNADAENSGGRNGGGIHSGLHGQWNIPNSPYLLTDNNNNLRNFAFWRLHGWIDDMWTRYRSARGLQEDDPEYQAELIAQCEEMHELAKADPIVIDAEPETYAVTGVFATEVAPIFDSYCAGSQCHDAASPTLGLALTGTSPSAVREGLVAQMSTEMPELALVDPGKPEESWIFRKITGDFAGLDCSGGTCSRMPPAGAGPTADEIERIRSWIADGATAD